MQANNLVVFAREVVAAAVHMGNLHEKARRDRLADVGIVVPRFELRRNHFKVVPLHEASKLLTNTVCALEAARIQKIIPRPLRRIVVALPSIVPAPNHLHSVMWEVGAAYAFRRVKWSPSACWKAAFASSA